MNQAVDTIGVVPRQGGEESGAIGGSNGFVREAVVIRLQINDYVLSRGGTTVIAPAVLAYVGSGGIRQEIKEHGLEMFVW